MKYCPNCAAKQNENNNYCEKCGEKFIIDKSHELSVDSYYITCITFLCLSLFRSLLFFPYFGLTFFIGFALTIKYRINRQEEKKLPIILLCINIVIIFIRIFFAIVKI